MNFLELAQRLRREIHDSGEGPAAVTGQRGRNLEYVEAIKEAWLEIQQLRSWNDDFWKAPYQPDNPQILTASTDTPFIAEVHHTAIVFYALQGKALSQNAQELVLRATQAWDKALALLCRDYLPTTTITS